jgi:hypothetical protein
LVLFPCKNLAFVQICLTNYSAAAAAAAAAAVLREQCGAVPLQAPGTLRHLPHNDRR